MLTAVFFIEVFVTISDSFNQSFQIFIIFSKVFSAFQGMESRVTRNREKIFKIGRRHKKAKV
jgi:hypothetical protein